MSSTNKTANIQLNSWSASDKPKRDDFNYDNEVLDSVLQNHFVDDLRHCTGVDRDLWTNRFYHGMYFGDGTLSRTIVTNCPFEPKFVIVFASARPTSVMDFNEQKKYNYTAFATPISRTMGFSLVDNFRNLAIEQDVVPSMFSEYSFLNALGVAYSYIMIR